MNDHANTHASAPETAAGDIIRISDLHLTLGSSAGEVKILRGMDLKVAAGETAAIVGPSGAGKSTLRRVVAGLERPTSGRVEVAGVTLDGLSEDALAEFRRANVGIVFQAFHLVPTMTALENVAIPLELAGRDDAFDRAAEGLAAVGLDHRVTHYPGQLSGGEQQRVAIARAFAGGPRLLLADEPTGNLDGETGDAVIDLLFDLQKNEGTTLILITHDMDLAARCDRRIHIADGRIEKDNEDSGADIQVAKSA